MAPIELATGRTAYYIGQPHPLMLRIARDRRCVSRSQTAIIGYRMETDIVAGIESNMETVLVLSGVTSRQSMERFPCLLYTSRCV